MKPHIDNCTWLDPLALGWPGCSLRPIFAPAECAITALSGSRCPLRRRTGAAVTSLTAIACPACCSVGHDLPVCPRGPAVVFYIYLILNLYSRNVVGFEVHASDQAEQTVLGATSIWKLWDSAYTAACPQLWPWRPISTGSKKD